MDSGFALAMALALAFAVTNGLHDASNAIAALVTTRGARPLQAALLAAVFDLLGPLLTRCGRGGHGGGDRHRARQHGHRRHRRRAGRRGHLEPRDLGHADCP